MVLSEVYGELLRAAGATECLMELLHMSSPVRDPLQPRALPWARLTPALDHGGRRAHASRLVHRCLARCR